MKRLGVASLALLLTPLDAVAEPDPAQERAIPRFSTATYFDISPPLREMAAAAVAAGACAG